MILKFPAKAIKDSSEDGESITPSVGDEVDIPMVSGVVKSIDGDNVTIDVESVNGCDCADDKEESDEPTEESVKEAMIKEEGKK